MPQTKLSRRLTRSPDEALIAKIWGTVAARGTGIDDLTKACGIPQATLYRRKKTPEPFTLGVLRRIGKYLDIPVEEFRQVAMWYYFGAKRNAPVATPGANPR
jgi:uncharacterized protein (DUF2384 family)